MPPITNYRFDPREISPDARSWSTRTSDGLTLRGWYLPTEKRRHLIVLVHGMWSSWLEMAGLGATCMVAASTSCCSTSADMARATRPGSTWAVASAADIRAVMDWAES